MKKKLVLTFLTFFIVSLSMVFAGGSQEPTEAEEAPAQSEPMSEEAAEQPEPAENPESEVTGGNGEPAEEVEYTESQEKLAGIGFQLPIEPFQAPDFTLMTLEGKELSLSDLQGKLIFLNFWATWCGPCRAEMPSMDVLYGELPEDKFEMIAVNVNEPRETVQSFVEENGYSFPILLDESGEVSGMYQVQGIPTTWIVGPEGDVLGRLVGTTEWDTPEKKGVFEFLLENN